MSHLLRSDNPDLPLRSPVARTLCWLLTWTLVCAAAAAPSFYIAADQDYDVVGMIVGVLVFVALYTAVTSTRSFGLRLHRDPALRHAFLFGYGVRAGLAVIFPISWVVDLIPGMISEDLVHSLGLVGKGFIPTLATTLTQGVLLNIIVGLIVLIFYQAFRRIMPRESLPEARGFAVLPVAKATPVESAEESPPVF